MSKIFFENELITLLKSYHSIIYIYSSEEERLENYLKNITQTTLEYSFYCWDFVQGYTSNPSDLGFAAQNPLQALNFIDQLSIENSAIIILKDFNLFLKDISVQRKLRNLFKKLKTQAKAVIITATEITIPIALSEIVTTIEFPLPNELEIRQELIQLFEFTQTPQDFSLIETLTKACQGLSLDRIRRVLAKALIRSGSISFESLSFILAEKKQIISQTQILEFFSHHETIRNIGGLANLKEWLERRSKAFSVKAQKYGLPFPKGLLLVGIQGTGKSLTAKVIANEWTLPLLRLDIGKLFGGLVGESESKMRQMIQVSEAMAPCVLWIDEIDKAFTGRESKGDSGTTNRVLGTFITWLSERQSKVFVVATANSVSNLPIEILRKGRLDEIFFLGLPSEKERELIFQVHLQKKRPKSWFKYDIPQLSNLSVNFSGAEIEQSVAEGMHIGFSNNREFTTQDVAAAISQCVPLAYTYKEQIQTLQEWASSGKIRSASADNI